jgi:hypothetical protein
MFLFFIIRLVFAKNYLKFNLSLSITKRPLIKPLFGQMLELLQAAATATAVAVRTMREIEVK